jgi:hypothetical protein
MPEFEGNKSTEDNDMTKSETDDTFPKGFLDKLKSYQQRAAESISKMPNLSVEEFIAQSTQRSIRAPKRTDSKE